MMPPQSSVSARFEAAVRWLLIASTPLLMAMHETEGDGRGECERRVASVEDYTADERAAAAELVSWISYTHPLIHRVIRYPHCDRMRWDFAQIPTAYMLWPDLATAPRTHRRFSAVCRYHAPFFTRRSTFDDFKQQTQILTGVDANGRLTAEQTRAFVRHLVENSAQIIAALGNPNCRWFNEKSARFFYDCTRVAPVLKGSAATVKMTWEWRRAFGKGEFLYLANLGRKLQSPRALELAAEQVFENFPAIVNVQRKFVELIGEAQTELAFKVGFELFLQILELKTVASLTIADNLPPSEFEETHGIMPSLPSPHEASSRAVISQSSVIAPPAFENRVVPPPLFSTEEIDRFLAESTSQEELSSDPADLERLAARLARVLDLTNASLLALAPWDLNPSRWTAWRDQFRPTRDGLESLTKALREHRDQAAVARAQFVRARDVLAEIEHWTERQKGRVAVLNRERALDLSPRNQTNLMGLHRDLPRALIMLKQIILMIDRRLAVLSERSALTTDLSLLVMHAHLKSVGQDFLGETEPIRAYLQVMVDSLTQAQTTNQGAVH